MQESFVDAAPHLGCSKVHPQPLTDRQPLSPTAWLLGGRNKDGGQVTMSRRVRGAHPAPLLLPKPHHHSDWSSWLSGEIQQLSCPCSATQTWLLSPHTSQGTGLQPQPRTQESCPKAQEGQHSPGCPCLPRHRGRSRTTRAPTPGWAASTPRQCLPALPVGHGSLQLTTGGFQQEQPELALNWCLSTESSKLHPQPPQNFHRAGPM